MRVQIKILKKNVRTILTTFFLVPIFGLCFSLDFINKIPLCEAPTLAEANINTLEPLTPNQLLTDEHSLLPRSSDFPAQGADSEGADSEGQPPHTTLHFSLNQGSLSGEWNTSSRQVMFWNLDYDPAESSIELGSVFIDSFRLPKPDDDLEEIDMSLLAQEYSKWSRGESCSQEELLNAIRSQKGKEQPTFQPSPWPTIGWISSPFGYRTSPFTGRIAFHKGIDIAARIGTPIYAVSAGIVTFSGRRGEYGNLIIIQHPFGFSTLYGHNSINVVKSGDRVECGQLIGYVGNTGRSTAPHLHYEIRKDGRCLNPRKYLLAKIF